MGPSLLIGSKFVSCTLQYFSPDESEFVNRFHDEAYKFKPPPKFEFFSIIMRASNISISRDDFQFEWAHPVQKEDG